MWSRQNGKNNKTATKGRPDGRPFGRFFAGNFFRQSPILS